MHRTTTFGRKRRTSALTPARRQISWAVSDGDHGDAGFVEDAVVQLHHLHGCPEAAPDFRGESLSEHRHLIALRRANVCRQRLAAPVLASLRSEVDEVGELARGQPGHPAALVEPTKRQAPVALEAVPAHRGGVERLATHGFHRIAEDRFNPSNLDWHFGLPSVLLERESRADRDQRDARDGLHPAPHRGRRNRPPHDRSPPHRA